jgi:RIO-like serine/threonine protein kinase
MGFVKNRMVVNESMENLKKIRGLIKKIMNKELRFMRTMEKEAVEDGSCVARSQLLRVSKMPVQVFDTTLKHLHDLGEVVAFMPDGKKQQFITDIDLGADV